MSHVRGLPEALCLVALPCALAACGSATDNGVKASGTIDAVTLDVRAPQFGRIDAVVVDEGDSVFAGDPLASLDTTALDLQIEAAQAALDAAAAQAAGVQAGARNEQLSVARAALALAESQSAAAGQALASLQAADGALAASPAELEEAAAAADQAAAAVRDARTRLETMQDGPTAEDLSAAAASVQQAQSAVDALGAQRDALNLTSPIDGVVLSRAVEVGQVVQQGSTVVQLAEPEQAQLVVFVPEDRIDEVSVGQDADISVDAFPDETFHGAVSAISDQAEFTPRNVQTEAQRAGLVFRVTLAVDNRDGRLRPGMPADAVLLVD